MEKPVSGPFLGQLYDRGSVIASCYFLLFTVDIISIAHRNAGSCGPPAPIMKAFRCLETCHFPQLCIPELRSDETCLYHSHDDLCMSYLFEITLVICVCILVPEQLWRGKPSRTHLTHFVLKA